MKLTASKSDVIIIPMIKRMYAMRLYIEILREQCPMYRVLFYRGFRLPHCRSTCIKKKNENCAGPVLVCALVEPCENVPYKWSIVHLEILSRLRVHTSTFRPYSASLMHDYHVATSSFCVPEVVVVSMRILETSSTLISRSGSECWIFDLIAYQLCVFFRHLDQ